jgi:hypothetical protein
MKINYKITMKNKIKIKTLKIIVSLEFAVYSFFNTKIYKILKCPKIMRKRTMINKNKNNLKFKK